MDNIVESPKKYQVIRQEIKSLILSGQLKAHEQIKTEIELAKDFNISRQTVRQALGELVSEGWLYRVQGRGTFVSNWDRPNQVDTRNIGLITTYLFSHIFPNIVKGAQEVLRKKEFGLLISSTDNDVEKERNSLESYLMKPLQGLIIEPTLSALPNPNIDYYLTLEEKGIPYVMTNANYPQIGAPTLLLDDEKGAHLAVEHVFQLGHTRIAGLFHRELLQGVRRMRGYISALKHFGLRTRSQWVGVYNTGEKERISALLRGMLDLPRTERPTALICFNDEVAIGLLDTIRELGLVIPDDLSVVGFDDSSIATASEVKLTTIAHPKEEMGRMAAQMLMDMIEKKTTQLEDVVFEPKLIVRQSTSKWVD